MLRFSITRGWMMEKMWRMSEEEKTIYMAIIYFYGSTEEGIDLEEILEFLKAIKLLKSKMKKQTLKIFF